MRKEKIEINGLESILIETAGKHLFRKGCSLAPKLPDHYSLAPYINYTMKNIV